MFKVMPQNFPTGTEKNQPQSGKLSSGYRIELGTSETQKSDV